MNYTELLRKLVHDVIKESINSCALRHQKSDNCVHLRISFQVAHAGVIIPEYLKSSYTELMPIILRNRFNNLKAYDNYFSVNLFFQLGEAEIIVPYDAIVTFADLMSEFSIELHQYPSDEPDFATMQVITSFRKKIELPTHQQQDTVVNVSQETNSTNEKPENVISLQDILKKK